MANDRASIDLAREADFTLDAMRVRPALRTVVLPEGEEAIEPRVMQVLVALSRKPGAVVTRDELTALCWDGRVVGEDAIQRPIAALRKLSQRSGAFEIETIARVGYRLTLTEARGAAVHAVLAVLPFDNFSDDREMTFFSDGVSDDILQAITRAVKVIGRASSFQFRGGDKNAARVAAELGATHLLDGSVRRAGAQVRISAQLIETAGQTIIWRAQFDRPARDLFAVQDEIATKVAAALNARLAARPAAGEIAPDVYEDLVRVRETGANETNFRSRIQAIDRVTQLASNFGPAWVDALQARGTARRNFTTQESERDRLLDEMRAIEARATALLGADDPMLASVAVNWRIWAGAWTECEASLRAALTKAPHMLALITILSSLLTHTGRHSEALPLLREVSERDPLAAFNVALLAGALGALGQHEEQYAVYESACRRWPDSLMHWRNMVSLAAADGRWDIVERWMAPAHVARYRSISAAMTSAATSAVEAYRTPSPTRGEDLQHQLQERIARTGRTRLINACHAAQFGNPGAVHDLLTQASFAHVFDPRQGYEPGDYGAQILFQPTAVRLRGDPRFVTLCARLGLVRHWIETERWPDCARTVPYDFLAEARRVAEIPLG